MTGDLQLHTMSTSGNDLALVLGRGSTDTTTPDKRRQFYVARDGSNRLWPAILLARNVLRTPLPEPLVSVLCEDLLFEMAKSTQLGGTRNPCVVSANIVGLLHNNTALVLERAMAIVDEVPAGCLDLDVLVACTVISNLMWSTGSLNDSIEWGQRAVIIAESAPPSPWTPYPLLSYASKLADDGRFALAESLLSRVDKLVRADHEPFAATACAGVISSRIRLQQGRFQEAEREINNALVLAASSGNQWIEPFAAGVAALVRLRAGEVGAAANHVWRSRAEAAEFGTVFPSIRSDWSEFRIACAQLGFERAKTLAATRLPLLLTSRQLFIEEAGAAPWLVQSALDHADIALATVVLDAVEELAARNPDWHTIRHSAIHARALIGRDELKLRDAANSYADPWASALAHEHLGQLRQKMYGAQHRLTGISIATASRRYREAGAAQYAELMLGRHEGVSPVTVESQFAEEWAALTDAQRTISLYVSQGMTNAQIARKLQLSTHTVNYHLRKVFEKFGICSRVELARIAATQL